MIFDPSLDILFLSNFLYLIFACDGSTGVLQSGLPERYKEIWIQRSGSKKGAGGLSVKYED